MEKRNKILYLIMGIGIGIVISSTLYSFFPVTKYVELSDDIIIEKAKALGMVSLKESLNIKSNEDKEVDNDLGPTHEYNTGNMEDEKEEAIANAEDGPEEDKPIKLVVKKGEKLSDIANNLLDLGLIDSVEEFKEYARSNGYSRILRYGVYEIKKNTSYSDIIRILTSHE
ncbi:MAG: endolytic transglycosylase MltG [Tissierellia bacterium]|nr:endolytic transglycosylase MltG [Tissierellia bacterium]